MRKDPHSLPWLGLWRTLRVEMFCTVIKYIVYSVNDLFTMEHYKYLMKSNL